jgi:hypothetical protein
LERGIAPLSVTEGLMPWRSSFEEQVQSHSRMTGDGAISNLIRFGCAC